MKQPDFINPDLWADFVQHRKEIHHALKPTTLKYLFIRLQKFHEQGIDVNLCIARSIENGWQGVFKHAKPNGTGTTVISTPQSRGREAAAKYFGEDDGEALDTPA